MTDIELRDKSIESQLIDFINFFNTISIERVNEYQKKSMMDDNDFINYLKMISSNLYNNKEDKVYSYLVDKYLSIIDEVIKLQIIK